MSIRLQLKFLNSVLETELCFCFIRKWCERSKFRIVPSEDRLWTLECRGVFFDASPSPLFMLSYKATVKNTHAVYPQVRILNNTEHRTTLFSWWGEDRFIYVTSTSLLMGQYFAHSQDTQDRYLKGINYQKL